MSVEKSARDSTDCKTRHMTTMSRSLRTCLGLARWGHQRVSARRFTIAHARSHSASHVLACLPNLEPGESRLVTTEGKDGLQIQDKYGEVMCRLGTADDYACDICEKDVESRPILYISKDQDDSWYDNITCTLCKPCVLAMFKVFEKTAGKEV